MARISAGEPRNCDFLRVKPSASILISSDVSVIYRFFYPFVKETFFSGGNRPWPKFDHLTPTSEEVKNEWSYASTPPIFLYGACGKSFPFHICIMNSPNFATSHITNLLQHFIKLLYLLKLNTYLLSPWSRVLLEKLTSKLCS